MYRGILEIVWVVIIVKVVVFILVASPNQSVGGSVWACLLCLPGKMAIMGIAIVT